ncbi:hypothetical protein FHS38_004872 [Streptomyces netropsis]|uniref:Uncharacterized protein n=1 Tax=Streptomyces netropsis TaxID=55404 RepID=A0A7W7PGG1_STRNE|nr:hypothetical protein [Streptomyces netropsis]
MVVTSLPDDLAPAKRPTAGGPRQAPGPTGQVCTGSPVSISSR